MDCKEPAEVCQVQPPVGQHRGVGHGRMPAPGKVVRMVSSRVVTTTSPGRNPMRLASLFTHSVVFLTKDHCVIGWIGAERIDPPSCGRRRTPRWPERLEPCARCTPEYHGMNASSTGARAGTTAYWRRCREDVRALSAAEHGDPDIQSTISLRSSSHGSGHGRHGERKQDFPPSSSGPQPRGWYVR